ncbi:GlcG/HbpS family heme-binding protein [Natronogracilivirga saccharolytica]|uniref:Heme-binding protein n=1 Tax=Natronogracilivirga saccharolytica TaxID=2812953 RepID=A0A8J7RLI2_9BACT|nr:heme-binding protein [Natronogracilivirga saccharolytica]MBP3193870.1 heme-binding protein [Natronogracilivirga saccharolytica]
MKKKWLLTLIVFLIVTTGIQAESYNTRSLTLEEARVILNAAEERAEQDEWTVAIAIVDAGGHLLSFSRLPGTQIASIDVAIEKAVTSVYYERPTKAFQNGVADGNMSLLSLPHFSAFEGGVPIIVDDEIIGAIGVSGVTPEQDGIIANAGAEALDR